MHETYAGGDVAGQEWAGPTEREGQVGLATMRVEKSVMALQETLHSFEAKLSSALRPSLPTAEKQPSDIHEVGQAVCPLAEALDGIARRVESMHKAIADVRDRVEL